MAEYSPRAVSLRELFPLAQFFGATDIAAKSCSCDSRSCQPGDVFVACVGTQVDGHDYVDEALRRGAVAVIAERHVLTDGLPLCVVENSADALGILCQTLSGDPSKQLKLIGISGTNGKTTTSCLVASILRSAGMQVGLLGTLGYADGLEVGETGWTTPPAPVLANWLSGALANGCTHAVMEVSSHALVQSRVAGVEFDSVAITNIRRDHLDYHTTEANYHEAKARLFTHLSPTGCAVLNVDDAGSRAFLDRLQGAVLTVSIENGAEVTATPLEQFAGEQTFLLSAGCETLPVRTRMIGRHHIENCLVAAAVALVYGVDLKDIVRGLELVERVPGRMERVDCGQPFAVFVDYAHTPDALECVLETCRDVTQGRVFCVFGAGGRRDRKKRPLMGSVVESLSDFAVVTNDNPRDEDPAVIIQQIVRGAMTPSSLRVIPDRAEAIEWALSQARPGDCVLIAGKGHEDHQIFGREKYWFDDRAIAEAWLYRSAQQLGEMIAGIPWHELS